MWVLSLFLRISAKLTQVFLALVNSVVYQLWSGVAVAMQQLLQLFTEVKSLPQMHREKTRSGIYYKTYGSVAEAAHLFDQRRYTWE